VRNGHSEAVHKRSSAHSFHESISSQTAIGAQPLALLCYGAARTLAVSGAQFCGKLFPMWLQRISDPQTIRRASERVANGRLVYALFIVGIAACFAVWASVFIYRSSLIAFDGNRYFCLFDDAMISMRYADNLANGLGLVWNPGEYVEGYSNPLMTLLMSVSALIFDHTGAVLAVQVFGVVVLLVNALLVALVAVRLAARRSSSPFSPVAALAFACALAYYPLAYWSLLGMETGLLAVLLSLAVLVALRHDEVPRLGTLALLGLLLSLAYLTRPDAIIFAVPVLAYTLWGRRRLFRNALTACGPLALVIIAHELFRWGYYGELLPNTYVLKVEGMPLLVRIENGLLFVQPFFSEAKFLLLVLLAGLTLDLRKDRLLVAGILAAPLLYQVWTGGDPWTYWRIIAPAVPLALAYAARDLYLFAALLSSSAWFRRLARNPIVPRRHLPALLALTAMLGLLWPLNERFVPEIGFVVPTKFVDYSHEHVNQGLALKRLTTERATVGVISAGGIPYYSQRPGVDFMGKTDAHIARLSPDLSGSVAWDNRWTIPGHNKYDLNYSIKGLRPTYVESFRWGRQDLSDWARARYAEVHYEGIRLHLLIGSDKVRWEEIEHAVRQGKASVNAIP
jgi:arabinofuranosyltransferase